MDTNNDQLLGKDLNVNPKPVEDGNQGNDHEPDYLGALVGEGKKYADHGNLAKGYAHLQAHNQKILEEKAEMERQLLELQSSRKTVDDVLSAIKGSASPAKNDDLDLGGGKADPQHLTQDDVFNLVAKALDQRTEKEKEAQVLQQIQANQDAAWEKLSEIYGDESKAKVALSLYVGADQNKKELVQNLGSYDPDTLATLVQTAVPPNGEKMNFGNADVGSHNQSTHVPVPAGFVTYEQSEQMRKTDKKTYNSRSYQSKLHASAQAGVWKRPSNK